MGVSSKALQRGVVIAMILATVAGAVGAYLVSHSQLHSRRSNQVSNVSQAISDAVGRRAYYLQDVADMVGVHDDADEAEFSRYAHVRGRNEGAIVAVEWIRRSPSGKLVPPKDISADPELVKPTDPANDKLGDAESNSVAAPVIAAASLHKQDAISAPVTLANGDAGFYLAVPVVSHRFSGDVSSVESQSTVVGLVDAQQLVSEALPSGKPTALQLRDRVTPLATIGTGLHNALRTAIAAPSRDWTLAVDGGSLTTAEKALPWLILLIGGALTFMVAVVLRALARRRDAALALAGQRSTELAASLERVEQANRQLESAREEAERLSDRDGVLALAERAREALAEAPIQVGDASIDLTISVGAALAADDRRTPDALVHAADQALYQAKDAGRNRVRIWETDAASSGVSAP